MTYWVHSGWQEGKKTPRGGIGKWWSFAEWEMQFVRLLMALSSFWRDRIRLKSSIFRFCFLTSSCIIAEETRPVWMSLLFGWRALWMGIDTSAHTFPHSESLNAFLLTGASFLPAVSSFADKGLYRQNCGFSRSHVWMWGLDHKKGWALKNWCFELWCWRRLLRVPWTAKRSNQSILKEISPEYSLEDLMPKLKLQYFGHLMQRATSLEKTLMLGKIEGRRRRGQQRMRWLHGITDWWAWVWANSGRWWWTGKTGVLQSMGSQGVGHNWATELRQRCFQYTVLKCHWRN